MSSQIHFPDPHYSLILTKYNELTCHLKERSTTGDPIWDVFRANVGTATDQADCDTVYTALVERPTQEGSILRLNHCVQLLNHLLHFLTTGQRLRAVDSEENIWAISLLGQTLDLMKRQGATPQNLEDLLNAVRPFTQIKETSFNATALRAKARKVKGLIKVLQSQSPSQRKGVVSLSVILVINGVVTIAAGAIGSLPLPFVTSMSALAAKAGEASVEAFKALIRTARFNEQKWDCFVTILSNLESEFMRVEADRVARMHAVLLESLPRIKPASREIDVLFTIFQDLLFKLTQQNAQNQELVVECIEQLLKLCAPPDLQKGRPNQLIPFSLQRTSPIEGPLHSLVPFAIQHQIIDRLNELKDTNTLLRLPIETRLGAFNQTLESTTNPLIPVEPPVGPIVLTEPLQENPALIRLDKGVYKIEEDAIKAVNALKANYGNGSSTKIIIFNKTSRTLKLGQNGSFWGRWENELPETLPSEHYAIGLHVHRSGAASGTQGYACYEQGDGPKDKGFSIAWDTPFGWFRRNWLGLKVYSKESRPSLNELEELPAKRALSTSSIKEETQPCVIREDDTTSFVVFIFNEPHQTAGALGASRN